MFRLVGIHLLQRSEMTLCVKERKTTLVRNDVSSLDMVQSVTGIFFLSFFLISPPGFQGDSFQGARIKSTVHFG